MSLVTLIFLSLSLYLLHVIIALSFLFLSDTDTTGYLFLSLHGLVELFLTSLDLMLLELLNELILLLLHLSGHLCLALVQLLHQALAHPAHLDGLLLLTVQLLRDFSLEHCPEDSRELADALVEEGQKLVRLKVQVRLKVIHRFILEAES